MDDLARRRRPRRYAGKSLKREFAVLAGFDPGAIVLTDGGPMPLAWLAQGDRVLTQAGGYEPVVWVERTRLPLSAIADLPELAPIEVAPGQLGDNVPDRTLTVSPSQLIHVARDPVEGAGPGVLIPAAALGTPVDLTTRPTTDEIAYVSVLLPDHHLLQADGAWMGSLFLADLAADLGPDDPIWGAFGGHVMEPVAPILGRREAVQFLAARAAAQAGKSA